MTLFKGRRWQVYTEWGFDAGEPKKIGPWLVDWVCHRTAFIFTVCVDREEDDIWNWWGVSCVWRFDAVQLQLQVASRALTIVRYKRPYYLAEDGMIWCEIKKRKDDTMGGD